MDKDNDKKTEWGKWGVILWVLYTLWKEISWITLYESIVNLDFSGAIPLETLPILIAIPATLSFFLQTMRMHRRDINHLHHEIKGSYIDNRAEIERLKHENINTVTTEAAVYATFGQILNDKGISSYAETSKIYEENRGEQQKRMQNGQV